MHWDTLKAFVTKLTILAAQKLISGKTRHICANTTNTKHARICRDYEI